MSDTTVLLIVSGVIMVFAMWLQHLYYQSLYNNFVSWFEEYQKTDEWKYKEEKKAEEE